MSGVNGRGDVIDCAWTEGSIDSRSQTGVAGCLAPHRIDCINVECGGVSSQEGNADGDAWSFGLGMVIGLVCERWKSVPVTDSK